MIEPVRESQRCPFCFVLFCFYFILFCFLVLNFLGKGSFRERKKEEWQPLKFCLNLYWTEASGVHSLLLLSLILFKFSLLLGSSLVNY